MSRSVYFRPIARREFDDAMAWYETQQPGLSVEFKEIDQCLVRVAEKPGGLPKGPWRNSTCRPQALSLHNPFRS